MWDDGSREDSITENCCPLLAILEIILHVLPWPMNEWGNRPRLHTTHTTNSTHYSWRRAEEVELGNDLVFTSVVIIVLSTSLRQEWIYLREAEGQRGCVSWLTSHGVILGTYRNSSHFVHQTTCNTAIQTSGMLTRPSSPSFQQIWPRLHLAPPVL